MRENSGIFWKLYLIVNKSKSIHTLKWITHNPWCSRPTSSTPTHPQPSRRTQTPTHSQSSGSTPHQHLSLAVFSPTSSPQRTLMKPPFRQVGQRSTRSSSATGSWARAIASSGRLASTLTASRNCLPSAVIRDPPTKSTRHRSVDRFTRNTSVWGARSAASVTKRGHSRKFTDTSTCRTARRCRSTRLRFWSTRSHTRTQKMTHGRTKTHKKHHCLAIGRDWAALQRFQMTHPLPWEQATRRAPTVTLGLVTKSIPCSSKSLSPSTTKTNFDQQVSRTQP